MFVIEILYLLFLKSIGRSQPRGRSFLRHLWIEKIEKVETEFNGKKSLLYRHVVTYSSCGSLEDSK
jgi:hypothetical protein